MKMQKFALGIAMVVFLICALDFSYAAPCYGTRMPQQKKFFTGLESYTVLKRYQEKGYGRLRSMQYFVLVSYGAYDWLSIDLKGGTGDIKQHPENAGEIDYPYNFAGGYGLRLRLYEQDKAKMVFGFQHISVHPKSRHVGSDRYKAVLDDWQVSMLLSHNFGRATPYIGGRWSRMDYIHRVNKERKRVMSDLTRSAGLILGLDFALTDQSWFDLEASFLDGTALAFSLNFAL